MKIPVILYVALTIALVIFTYSNTFNGEFQFDDEAVVVNNPYVKGISQFSLSNIVEAVKSGSRPFTTFTFALNYRFGGLDVKGYHIANLLIHIINGILIFYLVLLTMNSPKLAGLKGNDPSSVALISMAIFLLHPISSGAVNYISQRSEILVSSLYLLSLLAYIKARQNESSTSPSSTPGKVKRALFYLISVICYLLAMGSKEIAVTIPVMVLIYDFYFLEDRHILKRIAGPGVFIILSIMGGTLILGVLGRDVSAGFAVKAFTPSEYLMTQFRVLTTYIRLLFLPVNQNVDYDFRVSRSLFEADTALSLVFILILIIAVVATFKRWRIGSFFILWFFIILMPTSSIIPILDPIFEHRVYLASAGIFIIVSDALSRWIAMPPGMFMPLGQRKENGNFPSPIPLPQGEVGRGRGDVFFSGKYNRIAVGTVIMLIILLAGVAYQRNKVWQTRVLLWEDAARKSPMKARPHNNLGNAYMARGRYLEAAEEYKKALAIKSDNPGIYFNLALSLDKAGLPKQALYYYEYFYYSAPPKLISQKEEVKRRIEILKK